MDNAPPHLISAIDRTVEAEAKKQGLDLKIKRQPANSPDMNILDLGFFNAIQSIQNKHPPKNLDKLIAVVNDSFYKEQSKKNVDKVFMSLQSAMESVLESDGDNCYRQKHLKKDKILWKEGKLPSTFVCNPVALEQAREIVNDPESFFSDVDLNKHRRRMRSNEQVVDDVYDDEWDPSMQQVHDNDVGNVW